MSQHCENNTPSQQFWSSQVSIQSHRALLWWHAVYFRDKGIRELSTDSAASLLVSFSPLFWFTARDFKTLLSWFTLCSALSLHLFFGRRGASKNWMLPAPATKELASSPNSSLTKSYKSYSSNWKDKRTRPLLSKWKFSHQTQHFCCTSAFILHDNGVLEPLKLQTTGSRVCECNCLHLRMQWHHGPLWACALHLQSNSHVQVWGLETTMVD